MTLLRLIQRRLSTYGHRTAGAKKMRKLAFSAAGYALALIFAHYVLPGGWLPFCALAAAVLSLAGLLLKGRARCAAVIALLSAAVGFFWSWGHWQLFILPADSLAGSTQTVRAVAMDYTERYGTYSKTQMLLSQDGLPRASILVYDYTGGSMDLKPGDEAELELKFITALESSGAETDSYTSKGVYVRAYLKGECIVTGRSALRLLLFPKFIAKAVKDQVSACYPGDVSPLIKALLTGDKLEIYADTNVYSCLQTAGLSHVIAVSGMHVAFLMGALRLVTGRRRRTAAIGVPLILVFMAMAGFTPSVVRAGIMQILLLLAPLLRRESDPVTGLSAALLLILLINPEAIGSVSLQLSFAAMAGITLLSQRIYSWAAGTHVLEKSRLLKGAAGVVSSTIGALVFTVPLTALHFGYVPLYSVLTNILCLWAVSASFVLGYIVCLLGLIWHPLGVGAAWCAAWLARYVILVVRLIARLPYAALYTENNYIAWWITFVYAVFIVAYIGKGGKKLRPILPICACVITLAAVTLIFFDTPGGLTVTAVDVGQGQSIVVLQDNSAVMIDCGGMNTDENAGDSAAAYLMGQGKRRVDLLVLTHLHADHVNGVAKLMSQIQVERIAMPENADDAGYTDDIIALADKYGAELYYVTENMDVSLGGLDLTLYAPLGTADANERGLIILGAYEDFEFLVTGDVDSSTESLLTSFYELPDIELLVVGHHGSKYSTGVQLLDETTPDAAFISVGYNTYGHPAESVLERLEQYGIEVYRTDLDGTISLTVGKQNG